jgi:hypothetical protein
MGDSGVTEEPKRQEKDARESVENNRWDKIKGYLLDNPTLALTLLYLYVTAVGMLYSAVLYRSFGINIIDYSEIGDFLLAALKNSIAFLVLALQVLLYYATALYERRESARRIGPEINSFMEGIEKSMSEDTGYEAPKEPLLPPVLVRWAAFIIPPVLLVSVVINAVLEARSIKTGEKPAVEIWYRSFSGSAGQVTVPGLEFIGGTGRAAFFYDPDEKRTIVIPQAQLVSIEVPEQD